MSLFNSSTDFSGRLTSKWSSAFGLSVLINSLLFALAAVVFASTAFAQLAPSGEHYAGRPSDTGYGGTHVNATGAFAASVPLDLPPARGGLPIPLEITYGASGVGAAGLGWDLPLSYIQQGGTFAHRRPASNPDDLPSLRTRMYISLLGQRAELIQDGSAWVARYGTLELSVSENAGSWLAYDGKGRTYTFTRHAELGSTGLWLLKSVSGVGGANIQLTYQITTWPLDGGVGTAIDLLRIVYNTHPPTVVPLARCAKNEVALTYGNVSITPLSMSILGDKVLVRKHTLSFVDVNSRATCATPFQRLRRYEFQYAPDTDTLLPRLSAVDMLGRQGTSALPIANYSYGSATSHGTLDYQTTQTIELPTGLNYKQISGTDYDSSVNAPVPGDRYAMWQTLTDVTGDGRPDVVFKKNNKLWVAYNRPALDGTTTIGAGAQGIAQLSDATFSNGAFSTQTSTERRFAYAPANRNTTNVWRKAIDINGDGRIDIIDAAEEPDRWIVYLNTPGGATGVQWERRSFSVTSLREALTSSGHIIDGPYVPLSRRATGMDLQYWDCWKWSGSEWQWYSEGFSNHSCQGVEQSVQARGSERTFVEWDLVDLNGDGYPDFVFDSSPVDFQLHRPSGRPPGSGTIIVQGKTWHQFAPPSTNEVRVSFNVVGVRFDTDHDAFSRSVDTFAAAASEGVAEWRCPGYSLGESCDENYQTEFVGFADVNGDGLVDRVWGTRAYLGAYNGTAVTFSHVYITLPGPLATQHNNYNEQCVVGGGLKPTAEQTQGLRDLTGDGIPDYYDSNPIQGRRVWIGTGTGFRQAIPIRTTGATFQFSHETESCDGKESNTDGGLFDIDGDGRPEVVGLGAHSLFISQLVGAQAPGAPESGRLTEVDNGYGAVTHISYVSAKQFTDNPVPFPEIVVSSVKTTGTLNFGGTLAETRYAYSNAQLVFDSALDRFNFPGYGRFVELRLLSPSGAVPSAGKFAGVATISDTWPLAPFVSGMTTQQRWLRTQRVGRPSDVLTLRGITYPDPWSLLSVNSNDARVIGVVHFEWDAKMYELAANPAENVLDCLEMVAPLDYRYSFANNIGTGLDACRTHGFAFAISQFSWYGGSAPPSDNNIQTLTRTLAIDDFGQPFLIEYDNDVFRSDDDICVENTFAVPTGTFPRVIDALASRRFYTCGKNTPLTVASESWLYDHLPPCSVASGLITSHSVDRRASDTGTLLNTMHLFDATYDVNGNPATVRTQRNGAVRTLTFSYDSFGLVPTTTRLEATGIPTTGVATDYDSISLQVLSSGVAGQTRRGIDYDGFGRPIHFTVTPAGGSLGVLSTTNYFGFDSPDPDGRHITSTRFSEPLPPADISGANGRSEKMFLDELGRERRVEIGLGSDYANDVLVAGFRVYDDAGRVAFEADPFEKSQDPSTAYGTTYYFKDDGDLNCVIRGHGQQPFNTVTDLASERFPTCFRRSFSGHTQTLESWDAASAEPGSPQFGVVHRLITTAIGRAIEKSTFNSGVRLEDETLAYDHLGQLTSISRYLDPVGQTESVQWSQQHDSIGQTLQTTDPLTVIRSYNYSDWGEPIETRWMDGGISRSLVRSYDALGRLTATEERNNGITDPETENRYTYDTAVNLSPLVTPTFVQGRLAGASSPIGQIAFSYDAFGRPNAEVFADNGGGHYIERAQRDTDGRLRLLEFDLPDQNYSSETVTYGYDSAGRLRGVKYSDPAGALDIYNAEDLDPFGRVRKALIGGKTTFYGVYANDGRRLMKQSVIESPAGFRRTIFGQFDPIGRELSRREINSTAGTDLNTTLSYDALGRLSHAARTDGAIPIFDWHYSYDALGNLLALSNLGSTVTLNYSAADRDRICRIHYPIGGGGIGCNVIYNDIGDITREQAPGAWRRFSYFNTGAVRGVDQGFERAKFHYDAFGDLAELELTGPGVSNVQRDWRYGDLIERREKAGNGTTSSFISRQIPGPGGAIFASRRGTNSNWVFQFGELRGNRTFTNQDGAFVQEVDYQPFGQPKSNGVPVGDANYTGEQWNGGDALVPFGLSRLGARIYDPAIGRFLERDPLMMLRTASTSNPYAFSLNDPVNASDPSGLDPCGSDDLCISYTYSQDPSPLGLLGFVPDAVQWLGRLVSSFGGASGAAPVAPPVYTGPKTASGIELQTRALEKIGYVPKGFNLDTLAATGMSMSNMLDRLSEVDSPERDAAIDAYNAKWDRRASYSRVVGMTLFAIGTGGIAASEGIGLVLASRGMIAQANFFIPGIVGTGGASAAAANEVENELEELDSVVATDAAAAEDQVATPQVVQNRLNGNAYRDEIADKMRQVPGRTAYTEVYKWTPFGRRFIDVDVRVQGEDFEMYLGGIETKLGSSRYGPWQNLKDLWLRYFSNYPVTVVRGDPDKP